MIPVDGVVFPTDISFGSSGGPEFSTEIVEVGDGSEQRNQRWRFPKERWNVSYGVRTAAQLAALRTFFQARSGRARGFLFRNPRDYIFWDATIGIGDGAENLFQLAKHYRDLTGDVVFRRKITRPESGTLSIKVGGVNWPMWSCDYTTGVVNFFPNTPPDGYTIEASCHFYFPMRFDTDYLSSRLEDYLAEGTEVPLVEVRP
jgi:uncharacterized protein (TIGR02217 family)